MRRLTGRSQQSPVKFSAALLLDGFGPFHNGTRSLRNGKSIIRTEMGLPGNALELVLICTYPRNNWI